MSEKKNSNFNISSYRIQLRMWYNDPLVVENNLFHKPCAHGSAINRILRRQFVVSL